jgi:Domain of unknown function (DUF4112)
MAIQNDKTPQNNSNTAAQPNSLTEFGWIDDISALLDNRFTLPFTNIKFGVDFLIGLIPTVGDWLSFGISSILVFSVMQRGVGLGMLFKMMGNITLDAMVGSIPILGDLFDLRYKANRRNVAMLKQYYTDNPNPPSAKRSFFVVFILFVLVLIAILFAAFKLTAWLWSVLATAF